MEKYPPEQALNPSFQQEATVCRHELQRAAGGKEPGRSQAPRGALPSEYCGHVPSRIPSVLLSTAGPARDRVLLG